MQSEVRLVKYRRWYIPADAESYQTLVGLGMASTQIHEDMIPALKLVCKKNKIVLKGRTFKSVQDEFLETLIPRWERPGRRIQIRKGRITLSASGKGYRKGKKFGIPRSRNLIAKFCERWGITLTISVTENEGKSIRLVADFSKEDRAPVIDIIPLAEDNPVVLDFGRHRLRFAQDGKYLVSYWELKGADDWSVLRTFRTLPSEMADPTNFVAALLDVANTP